MLQPVAPLLALLLLLSLAAPASAQTGETEDASGPETVEAEQPAADARPTLEEVEALGWLGRTGKVLGRDYAFFYRKQRLLRFGGVLGGAGLLANTSADEEIQDWYRDDVRSDSTDDFSDDVNFLGQEVVIVPLVLGGLVAGLVPDEAHTAPGRWLRRSARAYAVGGPVLIYMQTLLGADRPVEGMGSGWRPFEGQNGVSGHAFIGAVPFLTLARQTDSKWLKPLAVAASTLGGWSQFNDDQHFFSQYLLGWWLAWESTGAVAEASATWRSDSGGELAILPMPLPDGVGVTVSWSF